MFVIALCKVQTVGFEKLATAFDSTALAASSLRRIQRFIALDSDLIAKLIFNLLPDKKKLKLSIDRINWQFGQTGINLFILEVLYKEVAFPLLFKMSDKRGNPNPQERIDLVNRFIRLFGTDCIDSLMADREFVGDRWQIETCFKAIKSSGFDIEKTHL